MNADFGNVVHIASIWILPVLLAVTLHEAAHGWVAWKLGDDTAYKLGRVTFNPLVHIDRVGTVIIPGVLIFIGSPFLFGWAKPVPVHFGRLGWPRRDMILVAAAGPGINLVIAFVSAALIHASFLLPETASEWVQLNLINSLRINVLLAIFNMLPLPPLDGGRVAVGLLPSSLARPFASIERYALFILIALVFILPRAGEALGFRFNPFQWLIGGPVDYVIGVIVSVVGLQ